MSALKHSLLQIDSTLPSEVSQALDISSTSFKEIREAEFKVLILPASLTHRSSNLLENLIQKNQSFALAIKTENSKPDIDFIFGCQKNGIILSFFNHNQSSQDIQSLLVMLLEKVQMNDQAEIYTKIHSEYSEHLLTQNQGQTEAIQTADLSLLRIHEDLQLSKIELENLRSLAFAAQSTKSLDELLAQAKAHFKNLEVRLNEGNLYIVSGASYRALNDNIEDILNATARRIQAEESAKAQDLLLVESIKAFESPVLLLDSSYEVIQSNQKNLEPNSKCYQIQFRRESPCSGCQLGQTFELKDSNLLVQSIHLDDNTFLNIYHDQMSRQRLQAEYIEQSKLNDLGVISASIAHELNNPLAGMLSYTQLLLMEPPESNPWYQDLKDIESGIKRARDIVDRLLIFTRHQFAGEICGEKLHKLIQSAIAIGNLDAFEEQALCFDITVDSKVTLKPHQHSIFMLLIQNIVKELISQKFSATRSQSIKFHLRPATKGLEIFLSHPGLDLLELRPDSDLKSLLNTFDGIWERLTDQNRQTQIKILIRRLDF